ncbi:MAG: hypothetical protein FI698_04875 [SAR202 cluster bacterium]|nr:hypothetical protein [SAR202 cluster bacterium]|tara:strand:+ start:11801 stop:12133 length:333 start_codon:yes stop_codon:yes gene_type:complete
MELSYMYKTLGITISTIVFLFASFNCMLGDKPAEYMIGRLINIESSTITKIRSIKLIDSNQRIWKFDIEDEFGHFTPSHLKEHMISGDLIKVLFYSTKDSKIVLNITDHP